MYEVSYKNDIGKDCTQTFDSLDGAISHSQTLARFVTISFAGQQLVGKFGVDSVESGQLPNGDCYTWRKRRQKGKVVPKINMDEIQKFMDTCGPGTRVYLGADSIRYREKGVWYAEYTVAVVVHINGNNGCKIFGEITRERDYDHKLNKPAMRLMNEVYKVSEMFQRLAPIMGDYPVEVHLDINPNEAHGSSCVVGQAIGYIRGTCNVIPMVKPKAFAASYAADRMANGALQIGRVQHSGSATRCQRVGRRFNPDYPLQ